MISFNGLVRIFVQIYEKKMTCTNSYIFFNFLIYFLLAFAFFHAVRMVMNISNCIIPIIRIVMMAVKTKSVLNQLGRVLASPMLVPKMSDT